MLLSCQTVPITGRHQLDLISSHDEIKLGESAYKDVMKKSTLSRDSASTEMVRRVGQRIAAVADRPDYQWEFNLVEDKTPNAFCLPGGKVVVYTGILPTTKDENGLAVVMGHEIAHAIADHGNERMSQGLLAQFGGIALSEALKKKPQETQALWMTVFNVGVQYGALLPYSRLHESEADHLGLIFMSMALGLAASVARSAKREQGD